jgi:hypothetical protein
MLENPTNLGQSAGNHQIDFRGSSETTCDIVTIIIILFKV